MKATWRPLSKSNFENTLFELLKSIECDKDKDGNPDFYYKTTLGNNGIRLLE